MFDLARNQTLNLLVSGLRPLSRYQTDNWSKPWSMWWRHHEGFHGWTESNLENSANAQICFAHLTDCFVDLKLLDIMQRSSLMWKKKKATVMLVQFTTPHGAIQSEAQQRVTCWWTSFYSSGCHAKAPCVCPLMFRLFCLPSQFSPLLIFVSFLGCSNSFKCSHEVALPERRIWKLCSG